MRTQGTATRHDNHGSAISTQAGQNEQLRNHAYMVANASHDPYVQDCLDQTFNGTSYLMILADAGLMKLFKVYYPGSTWAHDYTRVQAPNGLVIRLEMDHRDSGIGTGAYVPVLDDPLHGTL